MQQRLAVRIGALVIGPWKALEGYGSDHQDYSIRFGIVHVEGEA